MVSKWRIDGVFRTRALKKRGQVFTRVGLLANLYCVAAASQDEQDNSVKHLETEARQSFEK